MSAVGSRSVPPEKLQGALFDVDGTLVDSMPQFWPSWPEWGNLHGLTITEDDFYSYSGWPMPDILRDIYERQKGERVGDEFTARLLREYKAIHDRRMKELGPPAPILATVERARAHFAAGLPVVAATSGLRDTVEHHLSAVGLSDIFPPERIVCAADLPPGRGKPKPDIFLRAAEVAGVDPRFCVAYEDAEAGFEAAWLAGCHVIDVRDFEGYPCPPALKRAMVKERARRSWLQEDSAGGDERRESNDRSGLCQEEKEKEQEQEEEPKRARR